MNTKLRNVLAKCIVATMVFTTSLGGHCRTAKAVDGVKSGYNTISKEEKQRLLSELDKIAKEKNPKSKLLKTLEDKEDPEEVIRVIVELEEKAAVDLTEKNKKPSARILKKVKSSQATVKEKAKKLQGAEIRHSYTNVINGFSMNVKRKNLKDIKKMPGVKKVKVADIYYEAMNSAKELTQVKKAWENHSLKGQGMVVAAVDSGVAYNHKDFKDPAVENKKLNKDGIEKIKKAGGLKADPSAKTYFSEKVPFGYNYADKSEQIMENNGDSSHGAHVAGIMAADGDEKEVEKNLAIKGVAPKAQVLAMKVFTNNPAIRGAYSDDIIAAIDDSVALGADVINLSLGSDAGFQDDEDPQQIAIKKAADAGVMVVAAAGNSMYSTYPLLLPNKNDLATADSPGSAKDALMVANYENSSMMALMVGFKCADGTSLDAKITTHQVSVEKMHGLEIVDCAIGKEADFEGKDLENKIAIVKRGDNLFTEKILNAQKNNASGVIVYNNKNGDDELINMATDPGIKIPAIFITQTKGEAVLAKLKEGKVTIDTKKGFLNFDNPDKDGYSESTSWGPAPNLDFKPQIAGPGGNIFSTINNNKYEVMTGTSMASPHVAGGMTLIMESLKDKGLNDRNLVEYAKIKAMNTASVKMDKDQDFKVPYSPRRQGAGLIQIEDAIKTSVTATYKGEPAVALKEIKGNKATFVVDLKNLDDEEVTYDIGLIGGVLTQEEKEAYDGQIMLRDRILSKEDANLTSVDKVTVPAKGNKSVEFTLNIGNKLSTERFLEGYIEFKSNDENIPNIKVPFMGFYGDWGKEVMTSNNYWDEKKSEVAEVGFPGILQNLALCLNGENNDDLGVLGEDENGIEGEHIAINPKNKEANKNMFPAVFMLRNAKKIDAEIVNDKGEVFRKLGANTNIRKVVLDTANANIPELLSDLIWDGKSYDSKTGNYKNVPEGKYCYKMHMNVDLPTASEQVLEMPIKVDYTAPEIKITKSEKVADGEYKVYFVADDNLAGVNESALVGVGVNGKFDLVSTLLSPLKKEGVGEFGKPLYSKVVKNLEEGQFNMITILMFDFAANIGDGSREINCGAEPIKFNLDNKEFEKGMETYTKEETFNFLGTISRNPKIFTIGGEDVVLTAVDENDVSKGYKFNHEVKLKEGINVFNVKVVDFDDTAITDYGYKIFKDNTAPEITFPEGNVDEDNVIHISNRKKEIKCTVADSAFDFEFRVNGIVLKDMQNGVDSKYAEHKKEFVITEETLGGKMENDDIVIFTAKDILENERTLKLKLAIEETPLEVTVKNVENDKLYNADVTPAVETNDDTAKVEAKLNGEDFNIGDTISKDGKYKLEIKVTAGDGEVRNYEFNFEIDKTAPEIKAKNFEDGKEYEGKLLPEFEIEEGAEITYKLDGQEWDGKTAIDKLGEHILVVKATDKAGNIAEKTFKFTIKEVKKDEDKKDEDKKDEDKKDQDNKDEDKKDQDKKGDNNKEGDKKTDNKQDDNKTTDKTDNKTNVTTNGASKIPQTGSPLALAQSLALGGAIILAGLMLMKKLRKAK